MSKEPVEIISTMGVEKYPPLGVTLSPVPFTQDVNETVTLGISPWGCLVGGASQSHGPKQALWHKKPDIDQGNTIYKAALTDSFRPAGD